MQPEKEYLSQYNINKYERPSVTTDIAAFMIRSEESDNYIIIPCRIIADGFHHHLNFIFVARLSVGEKIEGRFGKSEQVVVKHRCGGDGHHDVGIF